MAAELRAVLEAAYKDAIDREDDDALDQDQIEQVGIFERRVREWLKEKAGEGLRAVIFNGIEAWESFPAGENPGLGEFFSVHLSPLFAALRHRAEDAEAREERLRERARMALANEECVAADFGTDHDHITVHLRNALREIGGEESKCE